MRRVLAALISGTIPAALCDRSGITEGTNL